MKYKLLAAFLILINSFAFGQLVGPKISFSETEYDFKDINEGEQVSHAFQVFNTGDDLLKIERVRASCGCTAALPEKKELKPGESTIIKVTFNSANRRGAQNKYVYVFSNDSENPEQRLKFTANVIKSETSERSAGAQLVLQKKQHNFGNVKEGQILDLNVKFKNTGTEVLIIQDVKSSCGCTAAIVSANIINPNDAGNLKIELDTSGYSGKLTRTVTVISNDKIHPTQTITLFVNVENRK